MKKGGIIIDSGKKLFSGMLDVFILQPHALFSRVAITLRTTAGQSSLMLFVWQWPWADAWGRARTEVVM